MKKIELATMTRDINLELGTLPVTVMTETEFKKLTGKRLAGDSYKVEAKQNGSPALVGIKFRDRSERIVKRFIYQAIGEVLWPTIPFWKNQWFGIVMAQPEEMPKDRKIPEGAKPRSQLLKLAIAQVKRST